jgi:hypothetical protein
MDAQPVHSGKSGYCQPTVDRCINIVLTSQMMDVTRQYITQVSAAKWIVFSFTSAQIDERSANVKTYTRV